ncbi:MAG: band 7 protein [Clostridia bacterium]|jgi:membrane protease subunit (stomatin/prohibitin family)|nr:band 7 protein [Clostridia bacterium]
MGFIKKQFLDIIQWLDDSHDTLVYMYPMEDQEIQYGGQLIVRPGQTAVFIEKGQLADVFGPGTYKLETDNLPILGDLKGWAFGFKSPFKSDIFFVNTKDFLNNKWGTQSPIWIPDKEYGQVQVRAFGTYTFHIEEPAKFVATVSSTRSRYTLESIRDQLREFIVTKFADIVGSLSITVAQIASNYNEIGEALQVTVSDSFKALGLTITNFTIGNISLPEEIEKALKELTSMNMLGSIQGDKLTKMQILRQLDIMEKSTQNEGLNAMIQGGMGLGMGLHMGNTFAGGLQNLGNLGQTPQMPTETIIPAAMQSDRANSAKSEGVISCSNCKASIAETSKFCPECGNKVEIAKPKVKFCSECGSKLPDGVKFCPECGTKSV